MVAAFVVLAGAAKEILIARTFGVDQDLDLYLTASALPLALVSLFGSAWQSAATPELANGELGNPGPRYFHVVRRTVIPITLVCGATAFIAAAGLPDGRAAVDAEFGIYLVLLTLATGIGLVGASWYPLALTNGRSGLVVAVPAAVHLGIAGAVPTLGKSPLALYMGLFGGYLALYLLMRAYALPPGFAEVLTLSRNGVRRIFRNLAPIASGGAAMALALPVDLLFAGQIAVGGPSIINYSTRVPLAASVVGASVVSTVVFSDLVDLRSDLGNMNRRMRRWLVRALIFSVLAMASIWFGSALIADILFASERLMGADLHAVVLVQQFAALSIVPFLLSVVFVRSFNAIAVNRPLLWISIVNVVINIVGNWLLAPAIGLKGIMLSTAIMYTSSLCLLWLTWRRVIHRRMTV